MFSSLEKHLASWPQAPQPWRRSLMILAVIFATEYALMFALLWVLPANASRFLEAAIDAALLTIVVSPMLWWTMVRPLQQAAKLRDHFLADLFSTIEDERRRIAYELHDGVGQTLTMLICGLRSLNKVIVPADLESRERDLQQLAQRALTDIKQLARGLRPSLLDDLGLAAAIERVAAELEEYSHLQVSVDVRELAGRRLPERIETALFRIFQEAVSNIVRHSGASRAGVELVREGQSVTLRISDNGCGIKEESPGHTTGIVGHLGLIGMQERTYLLGGTFAIDSNVAGTTITVTIPVRA